MSEIRSPTHSTIRAISREDVPRIVSSFACFACFLMNGAGAASLGAALPQLCGHFNKTTAEMGLAFTARGIGYSVGTIAAAAILSQKRQFASKEMLASFALIVAGVMTLLVTVTNNFHLVLVWFSIQGMGFGGIETMVNVVMPSIWGRRVQPWMQALFSFFGIGSMIGPAMVGGVGYRMAFCILAAGSLVPAIILSTYQVLKRKGLPNSPYCLLSLGFLKAEVISFSRLELDVVEEDKREVDYSNEEELLTTPLYLKLILASFIFAYVGVEIGFAAWVPSYALAEGITTSKAKAAYLVSIFWTTITSGRMISTVVAIYISAAKLIKFQLVFAFVSALLGTTVMSQSYTTCTLICACIGLSLSSIYPAMITIVGDYGFKIDAATTTVMITGGTLGASFVPILMDIGIQYGGPQTMTLIVFFSVCLLVFVFAIFTIVKDKVIQITVSPQHLALVDVSGHNSRHGLNIIPGRIREEFNDSESFEASNNPIVVSLAEDEFVV